MLTAAALYSCHSPQHAVKDADQAKPSPAEAVATPLDSARQGLESLVGSYREWADMSVGVKCRIREPKSISLSGKMTMVRDKEIHLSLRMLGFEVGGLYIDCDSMYVYEKLNRTLVVAPTSLMTRHTGLTIGDLQDILLGQLMCPGITDGANPLDEMSLGVSQDGSTLTLTPRISSYDWHYVLSRSAMPVLQGIIMDISPKVSAKSLYTPPVETDAGLVSPELGLDVRSDKFAVDATLIFNFETASWNTGISPARKIPSGYTPIPLDKLIKALGSY